MELLPGTDLPLTRGTVVVRPLSEQPSTVFFAFSDSDMVVDGVSFASNLGGPRSSRKREEDAMK